MTTTNKSREDLATLIKVHTPEDYQEQAEAFIAVANDTRLSPITLNSTLLLGQEGSNRKPYDIRNLSALTFKGIDYDMHGTSVTGQHANVLVSFENELSHTIDLGWQTAQKYIDANRVAQIMNISDLMAVGTRTEEEFVRAEEQSFRDYVKNYTDVVADQRKIRNIQSTLEKRQVQGLLGLDAAIAEASKELYKGLGEFIQSKEFFSEEAEHIFSLIAPRGGTVTRLQAYSGQGTEGQGRGNGVLDTASMKKLMLVSKHKKLLSPEVYAEYMRDLSIIDRMITPLYAEGRLKNYISDLNVLADEGRIGGRPAEVVKALGVLENNKVACTAAEILPFTMLYNVSKERRARAEAVINQNESFAKDYASGKNMLEELFIGTQGEWQGSDSESIPLIIRASLEGMVKTRADPILKEVQRRMRDIYASNGDDALVYASNSFVENELQTENIVVLARRKQAQEKNGRNIVMDNQRVNEHFAQAYGIALDEVVKRIETLETESNKYAPRLTAKLFDYYGKNKETKIVKKELKDLQVAVKNGFYHEAAIVPLQEMKFFGKSVLDEIISLDTWNEEDKANNELAKSLYNNPAIYGSGSLPFPEYEEKTYITPSMRTSLARSNDIAALVGDAEEWKEYENAIKQFKELNDSSRGSREVRILAKNGKTSYDVTSRVMKYDGSKHLITTEVDGRSITYINPETRDNLAAEMTHYMPLTKDILEKARFVTDFNLGGRGLLELQGMRVDGKMWSTFKNIEENTYRGNKWFIEDKLFMEINDWYVQAGGNTREA